MSDLSVKIDLESVLPYLADRTLALFGKDAATNDLRDWLHTLQQISYLDASLVQSIGMHSPVPLETIYQPTKITLESGSVVAKNITGKHVEYRLPEGRGNPEQLLSIPSDFAIIAGPGWGKRPSYTIFISTFCVPRKPSPYCSLSEEAREFRI
jgi:hypothetical protein